MTYPTDDDLGVSLRGVFRTHESLASPERAKSIATYAVSSPSPSPRRRALLAAGAVAAVALGTTVVIQVSQPPAPSAGPPTSSTARPGQLRQMVDADMERLTRDHLSQVLKAASLPAGLSQVPTAPVTALNQGYTGIPSPNALRVTTFWAGAGTPASLAGWLAAHEPAGWTGGGTGSSSNGTSELLTADFDTADANGTHGPTTLTYAMTAYEGGVAVRVDALGAWRPVRVPALTISPATVTGAELVLTRPPAPPPTTTNQLVNTVRTGRLSAAQARPVVAALNEQLSAIPPGVMRCPMAVGVTRDVLTLHTTSGDVTVTVAFSCGGAITVQRGGQDLAPQLEGNEAIDHLLVGLAATVPMASSTSTGR